MTNCSNQSIRNRNSNRKKILTGVNPDGKYNRLQVGKNLFPPFDNVRRTTHISRTSQQKIKNGIPAGSKIPVGIPQIPQGVRDSTAGWQQNGSCR